MVNFFVSGGQSTPITLFYALDGHRIFCFLLFFFLVVKEKDRSRSIKKKKKMKKVAHCGLFSRKTTRTIFSAIKANRSIMKHNFILNMK